MNNRFRRIFASVIARGAGAAEINTTPSFSPAYTEKVQNGDMELDTVWTNLSTPVTRERSSEQAHGGTYSQKLVINSQFDGMRSNQFASTAGKIYKVDCWIYGDGTNKFFARTNASVVDHYGYRSTSNGYIYPVGWTRDSFVFIESSSQTLSMGLLAGVSMTAGTAYFDDASIHEINQADALLYLGDIGRKTGTYHCKPVIESGAAGIAICYADANNMILASIDGTQVRLDKCLSGTWTNIISVTAGYGDTNDLHVVSNGGNYTIYCNYMPVGTINNAIVETTLGTKVCAYNTNALNSVGLVETSPAVTAPVIQGSLTNAANHLTTPTYDGSGQVIHPDVYDAGEGNTLFGYRYWLAITPFKNGGSGFENPSILASADGNTWVVPAGGTNPIEAAPGGADYNSDTELIVDGSTMYCYFRQTIGSNVTVYYKSSTDGITWADKVSVLTGTYLQFVSPTIIYDGAQWVMWYGDQVSGKKLYRRTAVAPTGPWLDETLCTLTIPYGQNYYHFNVHIEDATHYYMFATSEPANSTNPLFFSRSTDGLTWVADRVPLLAPGASGAWDESQLYRSAAIRTATGFDIWYSGNDSSVNWFIGRVAMVFP